MRRWLVLGFAFAACVSNAFEDGQFACDESGECPPGLFCAEDRMCRSRPIEAGRDTGTDATPDVQHEASDTCASMTARSDHVDRAPRALALEGDLYAGGSAKSPSGGGSLAWIARFDPCTLTLVKETTFQVSNRFTSEVTALAVRDGALWVAGNAFEADGADAYEAFVARVDLELADPIVPVSLPRDRPSAIEHAVFAADGVFWFGGSSLGLGWAMREPADGGCEVRTASVGSRVAGFAPFPTGGSVYAAVRESGAAAPGIVAIDERCVAAAPIADLAGREPVHMTWGNGKLYVVGSYRDGSADRVAYLAEVDPNTGAWTRTTTNNAGTDAFRRVATDGDALYVGAIVGEDPQLHAYALPLTEGAKPAWTAASIFGARSTLFVYDIRSTPHGSKGVFVAGAPGANGGTGGVILRCDKSGTCN